MDTDIRSNSYQGSALKAQSWSEQVRDFLNILIPGPGPTGSGPWIPAADLERSSYIS